jgi:hypothetical protein
MKTQFNLVTQWIADDGTKETALEMARDYLKGATK